MVTVVDCGSLMDLENGAVSLTDTRFQSEANYSCNNGYNLVGEANRTCQASGTWSESTPICIGRIC